MRELTLTAALLEPLLDRPHQPRLTFYDAQAARTELSTASLANWAAKVAGLLTDEVGARPGDRVGVDLPPGWLHLPVVLGAWWAGLTVTSTDGPDVVAAFVTGGADAAADEVFVVSAHPLGLPASGLAAHQRDLGTAARPHADRFVPPRIPTGLAAIDDLPVRDVLDLARAAAVPAGARMLVRGEWRWPDPAVAAVLGPLVAGGSLVACDRALPAPEAERLAAQEHAG